MTDPTRDLNDADASGRTGLPGAPGVPRWVKVGGIVAAVVIAALLLVMVLVGGEHGPGRHLSSAADGSPTSAAAQGAGQAGVRR